MQSEVATMTMAAMTAQSRHNGLSTGPCMGTPLPTRDGLFTRTDE